MVDTYHSDQEKFYYVPEGTFGVVPASPAMLGHSCSSLDVDINPNNTSQAPVQSTGGLNRVKTAAPKNQVPHSVGCTH